jgi:hypothetical protein
MFGLHAQAIKQQKKKKKKKKKIPFLPHVIAEIISISKPNITDGINPIQSFFVPLML